MLHAISHPSHLTRGLGIKIAKIMDETYGSMPTNIGVLSPRILLNFNVSLLTN